MKNLDVINSFFNYAKDVRSYNGNLKVVNFGGIRILVNYSTPLAVLDGTELVLNVTKYSATTSRIQNIIKAHNKVNSFTLEELNNLERGFTYFVKRYNL